MSIDQDSHEMDLQLVSFILGREEYAVDILLVQEITRLSYITRVPNAPVFVEGVMNHWGNVIPVYNLHHKFGFVQTEKTDRSRIIILRVGDITAGILVDEVKEVLRLPKSEIEPPSAVTSSVDAEYILGIGKKEERLLILLNIIKVLGTEDLEDLL